MAGLITKWWDSIPDNVFLAVPAFLSMVFIWALINPVAFNNIIQQNIYPLIIQFFRPPYYPGSLGSLSIGIQSYQGQTQLTIPKTLYLVYLKCTGSLQPAQGCGNTLVMEKLAPDDTVYVGDIVSYYIPDGFNATHQISGIGNDCYWMKGIGNALGDSDCVKRQYITAREAGVFYTNFTQSQIDAYYNT